MPRFVKKIDKYLFSYHLKWINFTHTHDKIYSIIIGFKFYDFLYMHFIYKIYLFRKNAFVFNNFLKIIFKKTINFINDIYL